MPGFLTRQPGTGLYAAFTIAKALVKIPWLLIYYYAIPSLRPHADWTLHQSLIVELFRMWTSLASTVEHRQPVNFDPGAEGDRFIIIEPHRQEDRPSIYSALPVPSSDSVQPAKIGAIWAKNPRARAPQSPGRGRRRRVFLHFHGGAFVLSSARDQFTGFGSSLLLAAAPDADVLCPEYRLSSQPNAPFPAALQDALTAYAYLRFHLGVPASDIVLSGDSAGANLALALLRYTITRPDFFGDEQPGGVLLWSPWVDLSYPPEELAQKPGFHTDYILPCLFLWAYRSFLPGCNRDWAGNPYISPVKEAVPTSAPMFVQWGGAEVLRDDTERFVAVQKQGGKGRLGVCEVPNAPHNIYSGGNIMGWKEQARMAVAEGIRFLDNA